MKAHQHQSGKGRKQEQVDALLAQQRAPRDHVRFVGRKVPSVGGRLHHSPWGGASSCRATRRALLRIARAALDIVMVARDTASMSAPTLNASRIFLPRNCAANCGGSTEKLPYGSLCWTTTMPA